MTNVLVVIADDMRYDHMPYLVQTRRRMATATIFDNARCNVALCQPNRAGFFTGQVSKHHNELSVGFDGITANDHDNTPAKWIADEGVRCGLVGKYQNFVDGFAGAERPDGWATWHEFLGQTNSVAFEMMVDATPTDITDGRTQIDYVEDAALAFLEGAEPWFLYVGPAQPHSPFQADPPDFFKWYRTVKSFPTEADFSSKPQHMLDTFPTPITYADRLAIEHARRGRLVELAAVDRLTASLLDAIDANGQLDDTIVIFTSDNGVHEGEHRRVGDSDKGGPYDVGLRVPLLAMGPGFAAETITAPVYPTQDIAATLVDVYEATPGFPDQAGVSLRSIAATPSAHADRVLLHEIGQGFQITGDGITTGPDHPTLASRKLYRFPSVRTDANGPFTYEMYDLDTDPDEMHNVASVGGRLTERNALELQLDVLLTPSDGWIMVPLSIDSTGASDVGDELTDWFATQPDGVNIRFQPDGDYLIMDAPLSLGALSDVEIDGNGATLLRDDILDEALRYPNVTAYLSAVGASDLTIRDLHVSGVVTNDPAEWPSWNGAYEIGTGNWFLDDANGDPQGPLDPPSFFNDNGDAGVYNEALAFEVAFHFDDCDNVLIEDCTLHGMGSDGVYFKGEDSANNVVRRVEVRRNGRQGVAIVNGSGYLLDDCDLVSTRSCIDLEPLGVGETVDDVEIAGCTLKAQLNCLAAGSTRNVDDVNMHDCTLVLGHPVAGSGGPTRAGTRNGWRIVNNVGQQTRSNACISIQNTNDFVVSGNAITGDSSPGNAIRIEGTAGSTGIQIYGNTFLGYTTLVDDDIGGSVTLGARNRLAFALGRPLLTEHERSRFRATGAEYTALLADNLGSTSFTVVDHGANIVDHAENVVLRDEADYALVQAMIYLAKTNSAISATTHRNKVWEVLDGVKDVTSFSLASDGMLVAAWHTSNLCIAAELTGYSNAQFDNYLENVILPILDWTAGGNWWMSFADSRLAMAAYLRDQTLWDDAVDYTIFHIEREYYDSTHDGGFITPAKGSGATDLWPAKAGASNNLTRTVVHWKGQVDDVGATVPAVWARAADTSIALGTPLLDGQSSEYISDLSHCQMGNAAAVKALRTMYAQGEVVPASLYDRVRKATGLHATRCLGFLVGGTVPDPEMTTGDGVNGTAFYGGWEAAARLFLGDLPDGGALTTMLARSEVTTRDPGGSIQMTAGRYIDDV